ncbi:hypothetical protein QVD17_40511 [Tagetes erecta]|uniref:Uncharacterized protein n=1 Tax=Tagetes erecta TaxID=13708 RepID=A0AAD8JTV9_TARER|nr:hypothetical protein QVD17_40511 [Tagetes erecta]
MCYQSRCQALTCGVAMQLFDTILLNDVVVVFVVDCKEYIKRWTVPCFRLALKLIEGRHLYLQAGSNQQDGNELKSLLAEKLHWKFFVTTIYIPYHSFNKVIAEQFMDDTIKPLHDAGVTKENLMILKSYTG